MSSDSSSAASHNSLALPARIGTLWPAWVAAVFGVTILYVVGFAAPHAIHEAAHDARHSLNFPCH